jgi:hypothetical protein
LRGGTWLLDSALVTCSLPKKKKKKPLLLLLLLRLLLLGQLLLLLRIYFLFWSEPAILPRG